MKTIIVAAFLLVAGPAHALSTNFFIYFDEGPGPFQHADWSGIYTITDGKLTAFSALIGVCADPLRCTWDRLFDIPPGSNPGIPGTQGGVIENHITNNQLDYIPILGNAWVSVNGSDLIQEERFGAYIVVATPELPAIWLLLMGSLLLTWAKLSKP